MPIHHVRVAALVALAATAESAWACSCVPYSTEPTEATRAAWAQADAVFMGKVLHKRAVPSASGLDIIEFTVDVTRSWKGPTLSTSRVRTPRSSAACGYGFRRGESYLIFANRDASEEAYSTGICSLTRRAGGSGKYIRALDAIALSNKTSDSSQRAAPESQITVLYDAFGRDTSMKKDWGFSALVEVNGKRILFDTGNNSEIFAHNLQAKGVDLGELDFVVMSHRHGDHVGGLNYLLSVIPKVAIYAPKENFGVFGSSLPGTFYRRNGSLPPEMRYFDGKPPETLRFGSPWPQGKFTWVGETTEVAPGFHLILLKGSWGVDLDVMEISLAIDTPEGIVLVVGCSHPTIERIVEATRAVIDKPVHLVIGGLHLLPAKDEETRRVATALRDTWQLEWIAPAHCTGEPAFEILQKVFGDHYLYAGLGTTVALDSQPVAGADK